MNAAGRVITARPASSEFHRLAEGPVWDAARERVLWVDIESGRVFEGRLAGDQVHCTARHDFPSTVGAVVCAADGSLLVAARGGLVSIDAAGHRRDVGEPLIPAGTPRRLNDGACDPAGRFLVGSLALTSVLAPAEQLWRYEDDGTFTELDGDLGLSNGLAWSPDGARFYSTDTLSGVVWVRAYEPQTGRIGAREVLLRITDGYPDGLCVDAGGNLWVAIWGAGQVRCFTPGGRQVATVLVDAPNTSSVGFVGSGLDRLLITTAREDLSAERLAEFPDSGRLFIADVDSSGLPTTPWRGT